MRSNYPTIILGGGFLGLFTALHLCQRNYSHPIILIDQRQHFTFKPLLYELLTQEIHQEQICPAYASLLPSDRISFIQDVIRSINLKKMQLELASGTTYSYGYLVLALGSQPAYFNTPGAEQYALPFTTAEEVLAIKKHLMTCLQQAAQAHNPEQRLQLLTVAVIGAGPAGVELACTLADILPLWYDELGGDYEELRLVLVNRSGEILKGDINSRLRDNAIRALGNRTLEVELLLDTSVRGISADGIAYSQHNQPGNLPTKSVIWTGGTEPHPLLKELAISPEHRDNRGRLKVKPSLQLPDFPEVFAGGDCAVVIESPQPATAQVAYQQGKAIADNLRAIAQGNQPQPAHVSMRGTLMKLGVGEGIANIFNRITLTGELGHLIRQATYLELLPTPAHNLKITTEWLTDEIFQRHQPPSLQDGPISKTPILAGATAILAGLLISMPLIWRAAQPHQFQTTFSWTGIPSLLDRLAVKEST